MHAKSVTPKSKVWISLNDQAPFTCRHGNNLFPFSHYLARDLKGASVHHCSVNFNYLVIIKSFRHEVSTVWTKWQFSTRKSNNEPKNKAIRAQAHPLSEQHTCQQNQFMNWVRPSSFFIQYQTNKERQSSISGQIILHTRQLKLIIRSTILFFGRQIWSPHFHHSINNSYRLSPAKVIHPHYVYTIL